VVVTSNVKNFSIFSQYENVNLIIFEYLYLLFACHDIRDGMVFEILIAVFIDDDILKYHVALETTCSNLHAAF
jgi:hypothetical protein